MFQFIWNDNGDMFSSSFANISNLHILFTSQNHAYDKNKTKTHHINLKKLKDGNNLIVNNCKQWYLNREIWINL